MTSKVTLNIQIFVQILNVSILKAQSKSLRIEREIKEIQAALQSHSIDVQDHITQAKQAAQPPTDKKHRSNEQLKFRAKRNEASTSTTKTGPTPDGPPPPSASTPSTSAHPPSTNYHFPPFTESRRRTSFPK